MSECFGAGTGCGWCRPFLARIFQQAQGFSPTSAEGTVLTAAPIPISPVAPSLPAGSIVDTQPLTNDTQEIEEWSIDQYAARREAHIRNRKSEDQNLGP